MTWKAGRTRLFPTTGLYPKDLPPMEAKAEMPVAKRRSGRPRKTAATGIIPLPLPKRPRVLIKKSFYESSPESEEDTKAAILAGVNSEPPERFWVPEPITGNRPPFSDWAKRVVDRTQNKAYVYGGRPCNRDESQPDFHCCDLANGMTWTDLTDELQFCEPGNPFLGTFHPPVKKRLPALFNPAAAFMTINKQNFVMLFGGYDEDTDKDDAESTLIAINVDNLIWYFVPIKVQPGSMPGPARMEAGMIAIDKQLFIFGGRTGIDHGRTLASYSALKCDSDGKWFWSVPEGLFPRHVPPMGSAIQVVGTYDGLKLLLLPGRVDEKALNIQPETMVYFHTINRTFVPALEVAGPSFPCDLAWYHSFLIVPRPRLPSRRHIDISPNTVTNTPAVLICGWRTESTDDWNPDGSEKLSIEVWRYRLTPDDTMECLNVGRITNNYQRQDFQDAITIGDRLYILGSEKDGPEWWVGTDGPVVNGQAGEIKDQRGEANATDAMDIVDYDELDESPRWYNVRMEIPLS